MYQNLRKRAEGFTIIEVLIVLAIAGLIMLIVFLAVPALQRNSRNNARNNDASRISAAVTECLANRNNRTDSCDEPEEISVGERAQLTNDITFGFALGSQNHANVFYGTRCNEDNSGPVGGGAARDFTVLYQLEAADGGPIQRCIAS